MSSSTARSQAVAPCARPKRRAWCRAAARPCDAFHAPASCRLPVAAAALLAPCDSIFFERKVS
eukprot:5362893-Prymnesium_polylepis.1